MGTNAHLIGPGNTISVPISSTAGLYGDSRFPWWQDAPLSVYVESEAVYDNLAATVWWWRARWPVVPVRSEWQ